MPRWIWTSRSRPSYISSKQKLVDWIWKHTPGWGVVGLNVFSGSAVVAYMYENKGIAVVATTGCGYCQYQPGNKGDQLKLPPCSSSVSSLVSSTL